jgi:hypothetical protein
MDTISVYNLLKKVRFVKGLLCLMAGEPWLQSFFYTTVRFQAKGNRQAMPLSLAVALWDRVFTVNSEDEVYKLAFLH